MKHTERMATHVAIRDGEPVSISKAISKAIKAKNSRSIISDRVGIGSRIVTVVTKKHTSGRWVDRWMMDC